ncbi:putative mitochondrial protein [Tanacetum coccineum]|uniref:Mitochondrial protein n=1 Tax=Tanacetum coccineum TaxID=301880 RepID=A0ABQ5IJN1_9ASTR
MDKVEYLGHLSSAEGVSTDPLKIQAIKNWPRPNNVKQISLQTLKEAMISTPLPGLPNFNKEFVVETDACDVGIGVVLLQEGHPIAYMSNLLDKHFKIKTDHFSLKYLLDQRLTTPFQTKWLPKQLGFDYEISYKKGSENVAVDALSKVNFGFKYCSLVLSTISSPLLQQILESWTHDAEIQALINKLQTDPNSNCKYTWVDEQLKRKGRLVVGNNESLKQQITTYFYKGPLGGHSGVHVTTKKLADMFFWKGLKKMPLPIHTHVRSEIFIDFIEVYLNHMETSDVAKIFLNNIYKVHGIPKVIVSDRDKVFISHFWKSLFKVLKVQLYLSTSYHPQTDGRTEVVNRSLGCYLRCMTEERPKELVDWLALVEFWYNTNSHSFTKATPFEIVYGQPPPIHLPYVPGDSVVEAVDRSLQAIEQVYVKLQPYIQVLVRHGVHHKLSTKYFGPFQAIGKIREVDYKSQLPTTSLVHPVFHVSQLKKCHGQTVVEGVIPRCEDDGRLVVEPVAVLERR